MPTIIVSKKDIAGMTILKKLKEISELQQVTRKNEMLGQFEVLKTSNLPPKEQYHVLVLENDHLVADFLENAWKDDFFIFLSRHSAKSGIPSMTVHFTGNWTDNANFGGKPRTLSMTCPSHAKYCFLRLHELLGHQSSLQSLTFQVTYEVTHHGPLLTRIPAFFLELGSNKKQWTNESAASLLATLADEIARKKMEDDTPAFLGVGGTHYAERFNQIAKKTRYAPAHLLPKYFIEQVTRSTLEQALTRNPAPLAAIVIDHSGTNSRQRQHIKQLLEEVQDPPPLLKVKDVMSK